MTHHIENLIVDHELIETQIVKELPLVLKLGWQGLVGGEQIILSMALRWLRSNDHGLADVEEVFEEGEEQKRGAHHQP